MRRAWSGKTTFLAFLVVVLAIQFTTSESPAQKFLCPEGQFACTSEKCIVGRWQCDGEDDCGDNSDEAGCAPKTCRPNDQFRCGNGKCIPKTWLCDQEDDCKDGNRTDEQNCGIVNCGANEFKCQNGKCIVKHWICDKNDDCGDNSDEKPDMCSKVPPRTCSSDQFTCDNGQCISNNWKCDKENDCDDQSDERPSVCAASTCASNEYQCKGNKHKCILSKWKCDGDNDCPMGDDEDGCPDMTPRPPICSAGMFQCKNKECILGKWKCDGEEDCSDGSDEKSCPKSNCTSAQFACARGGCIPAHERCNGNPDCSDGSDEISCSTPAPCTADEFKCGSTSECIPRSKMCDGKKDCPNNEDENMRCRINECLTSNGHCQHVCNDLLIGYNCSCFPGYTVSPTNPRLCEDIDECLTYGQCSQTCINYKGGHKCTCRPGYILEPDHKTCKAVDPAPYLVFSSQTSLRKMTLTGYSYNSIVTGRKGAVGVDFDIKTNKIFWTDPKTRKIHRANLDGTGNIQDIVGDVRVPDGIAVDWVGRKIYWTDGDLNMIEVAELDGSNRMTLYDSGLDEPRAIAVNPATGYIYWSDWGNNPRIERGAMDGTGAGSSYSRRTLVNTDLGWVNGMTIDYSIDRIYWVDARLKRIETIKLDGTDRRLVTSILNEHPFSVTVFENYLYYSDWNKNERAIRKVNKFTGKEKSIVKRLLWSHMDIKLVHPHRQPNTTNSRATACTVNNGGCSHLCLLAIAPKLSTCKCPNGMNMSSNGKTCIGKPFTGQPTPSPTHSPRPVTRPATTPSVGKPTKTRPITNHIRKPTKTVTTNNGSTQPTVTPTTNNENPAVAHRKDSSSSNSGPNLKVIIPIIIVIVLILILIAVGYWFWRTRYSNYKPSISYYKDMSTKPLEEDFDDNETTKVFDDGGPRCKVEFA